MADELNTKRIINLPAEYVPDSGDVLVVDNQSNGTKKLPVSYFENEINGKIAKPTGSPDGKNGQLLRTNGDGTTEWTDFAAPTDEQVGSAISEWLDNHPEATTTVQNWSLTAEKFVKGSLGYITPQMYGAKADGVTDDAPAIQSAINYAMANNCAVYFPSGTYAINPRSINIDFTGDDSLVMYGDGKTSCIKRMDESLANRWDTLFVVNNTDATADSGLMYVHDLYIDSNRRNQSNATDDFTYEASADFMIFFSNANGYSIDTVIFENLWFYDGVADHLDFTGGGVVHIKNIVINKVFTSGRQGTRNDIDFPGIPMENVFISNVACERIHTEYNGDPANPQYFYLNNVVCDEFTCGGKYNRFKVENLTVNKQLVFGGESGNGLFTNCEFNLKSSQNYLIAKGKATAKFVNCIFKSYDSDTPIQTAGVESDCTTLYIRPYFDITFSNCKFAYVGEYDYSTKTLVPISTKYFDNADDTIKSQTIILDGCDMSEKYSYTMLMYGCGTVKIRNMEISTKYLAWIQTVHGVLDVTFENVRFNGEECLSIQGISNSSGDTCYLHGNVICKQGSVKFNGSINQYTRVKGDLKLTQYVNEPLTRALLNSIYRLPNNYFMLTPFVEFIYAGDNKEAYPDKWECIINGIVPNSQFDNARRFKSIGSGTGDAASRPTCILSPGFEYYDTDIGKPIFWNGSGWVDSSGTTI